MMNILKYMELMQIKYNERLLSEYLLNQIAKEKKSGSSYSYSTINPSTNEAFLES